MSSLKISNTAIVINELDNYLRSNNYFENEDTDAINEKIRNEWVIKLKDSITNDLRSRFDNIEVEITLSEFELFSQDNQDACVFFHRATITDKGTKEAIKIIIKSIVNHDKIHVYLASEYANALKWEGDSKTLKTVFNKLKQADKTPGYFAPIAMDEFIKKTFF